MSNPQAKSFIDHVAKIGRSDVVKNIIEQVEHDWIEEAEAVLIRAGVPEERAARAAQMILGNSSLDDSPSKQAKDYLKNINP